jgi:hypothetical protein
MMPRRRKRTLAEKIVYDLIWVGLFGVIASTVCIAKAYAVQDETVGRIRFDDSTIFLYADVCKEDATMRTFNFVDFAMNSHRGCWKIENNMIHVWYSETNKINHMDKKYIKGLSI